MRITVEVGDSFKRRAGDNWLRQVTAILLDDFVEYVQYYPGDTAAAFVSSCSESAMKGWGEKITGAEARALYPNLDEMCAEALAKKRATDRALVDNVQAAVIESAPDAILIGELVKRGYMPPARASDA
jgi:hypothetical protein